jgi:hypothetical protein
MYVKKNTESPVDILNEFFGIFEIFKSVPSTCSVFSINVVYVSAGIIDEEISPELRRNLQ